MTGHRCGQPLEALRPEDGKPEGQEDGYVVAHAWLAEEEEAGWEDEELVAGPHSSACENDGRDWRVGLGPLGDR